MVIDASATRQLSMFLFCHILHLTLSDPARMAVLSFHTASPIRRMYFTLSAPSQCEICACDLCSLAAAGLSCYVVRPVLKTYEHSLVE